MVSIGGSNLDTARPGVSVSMENIVDEVKNVENLLHDSQEIQRVGAQRVAREFARVTEELAGEHERRRLSSLSNPNNDFFYYRNDQTINSLSILKNDDGNNREIKYPDVLSHEIIKSQYQPLFRTNEFSILPDDIHRLKKDYINDIHNPNANRFFLSTDFQRSHRETYYNNLKNNNLIIKETYNDVFNILSKKDFYSKKHSFGNKVAGFYLNSIGSSVLGKLANIALDNENINFANNHGNNKFYNKDIEEIRINSNTLDFDYFDDEEKKKLFSIMFSSFTDDNKLYKDCNENNFIVNSDKIFNQNLLNTSISLNGIYKDSLYNHQNSNDGEKFKESLKLIDSESFDVLPILKNESILNKIDNNEFFNPYLYDNVNKINHTTFNIAGLNPDSYMKKDQQGRISSINSKVGDVFNNSLFLSNKLSKYIRFIDTSVSYIDSTYNEKQNNIPLIIRDEESRYSNYFFNHSIVPEIRFFEKDVIAPQLAYMSDIRYFDNKNLDYHIGTILGDSDATRASKILNSPKFVYNFKRTNEDFDSKYPLKKIDIIVTENALNYRFFESTGLYTRYPLPTFNILFNQWAFRKYSSTLSDDILNFEVFNNEQAESDRINNSQENRWSLNLKNTLNYYTKEIVYESNRSDIHKEIKNLIFPDSNDDSPFISKNMNDYSFDNATGFVLFKNSMNNVSVDELHKKFVLFEDEYTVDSEFSPNRIVLSSSKNNVVNEGYVETSIDDIKKVSFEDYGYSWQKISLDLSNNMFELKKKCLENNNKTDFLKYMLKYKEKVKSVKQNNPDFSLAYSDVNNVAVDKKESSDFLASLDEDLFIQKFNFSEPYGNVKNSITAINNQSIDEISLEINANSVKEYASLMYKNSIFKTEKVYYDFIKDQTSSIIESITDDAKNSNLGPNAYDKLLSDVIINKDDDFIFEILASSAISEYKGLLNESIDFLSINNSTGGDYENYLNSIYSVENIKRQKSYNLRTYKYPDGNISQKFNRPKGQWSPDQPEKNTAKISYDNADFDFDIDDHVLDCGILPGNTFNFCFPFVTTKYNYKSNKEKDFHCSIYKDQADTYLLADKKKFDQVGNTDANSNLADLYEFYFSSFYNNDVYLDVSKAKSVMWRNIKNVGPICEIKSLIKDNFIKKVGTEYYYVNFENEINNLTFSKSDASSGNIDPFQDLSDPENPIDRDHSYGYRSVQYDILDYTFSSRASKLKSVINRIIMDCFFQFSKDFNLKIASLSSIERIYRFVKDNSEMSKNILGLLKPLCLMYTTYFDSIVDLSIRNFLYKSLNDQTEYQAFYGKSRLMWDEDVVNLVLKPREIGSNKDDNKKYKLDSEVATEDNGEASEMLYLKFHSEIGLISKALSNSSILNIMSIDNIFSYFTEFENFKSEASVDSSVIAEKLESLEENLNIENSNDLLSNKSRINLIAKNLNDYYYYQTLEYNKYYNLQRNINTNLKAKFDNVINNSETKMFSTHLKRDETLASLARQSTDFINGNYQQYDVVRFGIDLEMSEVLRNRRILKFKINIFNHKYPNITVPSIYKFYTPIFTEVTPAHFNLMTNVRRLDNSNYTKRVEDNLGFYDYNEDSLKDRYRILSKNEGIAYVSLDLINNVNNERMFNSEESLLDITPAKKFLIGKSIVESAIISNMIKHIGYINQKEFNENNIRSINVDNLNRLSNVASGFFNSLNKESFEQIFLESYDNSIEVINEEEEIDYNTLFEKKVYSLDFLNKTSDYIDLSKIENIFSDKKLYDVFSILISRKDIKDLLEKQYAENNRILRIITNENFFDSFSYVIQAEIV